MFVIFPSSAHTVWFWYFSANVWWITGVPDTNQVLAGPGWLKLVVKTAVWICGKKNRNKDLFHMFCVRSEWQCNPRVLQGWVSRPPQESNTCCWCLRILAVLSVKCQDKQHYICIYKKEKARRGARWHYWIPQAARTEINLQKCLCSCIFKGREGRGSVRWNSNKI